MTRSERRPGRPGGRKSGGAADVAMQYATSACVWLQAQRSPQRGDGGTNPVRAPFPSLDPPIRATDMKQNCLARLVFTAAVLLGSPAGAQVGTPGNAPLTPDGPRRGLGPPSISDNVPDLPLRSDGGGIPGAGPPIIGGGAGVMRGSGYGAADRRVDRNAGRFCETPRRSCPITSPARIETACSCRLPNGARVRGRVVR